MIRIFQKSLTFVGLLLYFVDISGILYYNNVD